MTSRPGSGRSVPNSFYTDCDNIFNNFLQKDLERENFPRRQPRSAFRDRSNKFDQEPRTSSSTSRNHRNFSPGSRVTGEDILNKLKDQLRKESDMFCYSQPEWDTDMHPRKADDSDDWANKGFEEMRSRHPMFRMPNWMSEDDDDISNLASRMSQSPHFASMGRRGGPWRERRNSGGSAMSGTSEEDSVDGHNLDRGFYNAPNAVRIPIRIEAEAPPGYEPQVQKQEQEQKQQKLEQQHNTQHDPQVGIGQLKNQPHYASKTTSSMDTVNQEVPRSTRCSSAPPDMTDPLHGHRFVSKATIVPQNVNDSKQFNASPDFNNVAKPFVSSHKLHDTTAPIFEENSADSEIQDKNNLSEPSQKQDIDQQKQHQQEEKSQQPPYQSFQQQQHPHQSYQEPTQHNWDNSGHKSSVVRTIPIVFEGKKTKATNEQSSFPSRSPPQVPQYNRPSQRDPFHDPHFGFSSHGFSTHDPFFSFSNPSQQHFPSNQDEQYPEQQHQYQQPQKSYPPQQSNYQHPQKQYQQQEPQPQPQPQPKEKSPQPELPKDIKMDAIDTVRASVTEFKEKAKQFEGTEKNKEFLFIDEMLTRALLKLDNIDPDGRDDVRQARRTLIKDINNTISNLEKKVSDAAALKRNESVSKIPDESENKTQSKVNETESNQQEASTNDKSGDNKTEIASQDNQEPVKTEVTPALVNEPVDVKSNEDSQLAST